jgi:hypothetical protein
VEGDSDADFVIDTDTTVSKFDDDMMLDTHRNADEWPESSDGSATLLLLVVALSCSTGFLIAIESRWIVY